MMLFILALAGLGLLLIGGWGLTVCRMNEACCERCRYPVKGLVGIICPECGGDLQGKGTRQPGEVELRAPAVIAIPCRIAVVAIPVVVLLGMERSESTRVVSTAVVHATSGAGLYQSLHIRGRGTIYGVSRFPTTESNPRPQTRAVLTGPAGSARLKVRDAALRAEYDGPDGRRVSSPDAMTIDDVLNWMRAAGIDVAHEHAEAEARSIHRALQTIVIGRGLGPARALRPQGGVIIISSQSDRRITSTPWRVAVILLIGAVPAVAFSAPLLPEVIVTALRRRLPGRCRAPGPIVDMDTIVSDEPGPAPAGRGSDEGL